MSISPTPVERRVQSGPRDVASTRVVLFGSGWSANKKSNNGQFWGTTLPPLPYLPHLRLVFLYSDTHITFHQSRQRFINDFLTLPLPSPVSCPSCFPQRRQRRPFFEEHLLLPPCRLQTRLASGWLTLPLLAMTTRNVSVAIEVIGIVRQVITAQSPPQLFYSLSASFSPY